MPVIFKYIVRQVSVALVAGQVAAAVGPLSDQSLDEALGFAVSLRPVRPCEAVFDAPFAASCSEGVGGVAGAVVGKHFGDLEPVEGGCRKGSGREL